MSQVKKLQSGGSAPVNLNDLFNEEFDSYKFKSKDERKVRDAFGALKSYIDANPDSFKYDPVVKRYTVTGLDNQPYEGSPDDVRANWFTGKLKIKDNQDAMSVAAAIYGSVHEKANKVQATTSETGKERFGVANIRDYMMNVKYGTPEAYEDNFLSIKDDNERKKIVLESIKEVLAKYGTDALTNKDKIDYYDLSAVQKALDTLGTGEIDRWDAVKTATFPIKWNLNEFLMTADDKTAINQATAKTTAEQAVAAAAAQKTDWLSRGVHPGIYDNLINSGYISLVDELNLPGYTPEQNKTATAYVKDTKKGLIARSNDGRYLTFDRTGNPIDATGEDFNQFNPLYGEAWKNDWATGLMIGKGSYTAKDYGAMGRGLEIPSYPGWAATGYAQDAENPEPTMDFLQNRDYTKYIIMKRPGMPTIRATKGPDGIYRDQSGKVLPGLKITGYKEQLDERGNVMTDKSGEPLNPGATLVGVREVPKMFRTKEYGTFSGGYKWRPENWLPTQAGIDHWAKEVVNILQAGAEIDADRKDMIQKFVNSLLFRVDKGTEKERLEALNMLKNLEDLLIRRNITLKSGGIIKAQSGSSLKKQASFNSAAPKITQPSDEYARDISGLVRGSTGLDKLILAANAASLAPALWGSAAAGVSTVLEGIRDATDDDGWTWGDTGNLALNLGLVGASFVGLGGLRGLKAGKLAKNALQVADKAEDLVDFAKLGKFGKFAKEGDAVVDATKIVTDYSKTLKGVTNLGNLKDVATVTKNVEVVKAIDLLQDFSKQVANTPKIWDGLAMGKKAVKTVDVVSKGVAYGNAAMNIAPAAEAFQKVFSGDVRDLTLSDVNALTAVAFGAKVGIHHTKTALGKKYGVVSSSKAPAKLTAEINGKVVEVTDSKAIKSFRDVNVRKSSKAAAKENIQKAFQAEYNKGVPTKDHIKIEDLKDLAPIYKPLANGASVLRKDYDLDKNLYLQEKGIKWAKKYRLAPEADAINQNPKITRLLTEGKPPFVAPSPTPSPNPIPGTPIKPGAPITVKAEAVKILNQLPAFRTLKALPPHMNNKVYNMGTSKGIKTIYIQPTPVKQLPGSKPVLQLPAHTTPKVKTPRKKATTKPKKGKGGKGGTQGTLSLEKGGTANPSRKQGFWNYLQENVGTLDNIDVANALMYTNTLATNRRGANLQLLAAEPGIPTPLLKDSYLPTTRIYSPEASKRAAMITSQGRRIANSTADFDKSTAIQLESMNKANEILDKGQAADAERSDKLKMAQLDRSGKIDQYNINITAQNNKELAQSNRDKNLILNNKGLADNTAFGNFVTNFAKNRGASKMKFAAEDYFGSINDPELKALIKEYETLNSNETKTKLEADFEAYKAKTGLGVHDPIEKSFIYKKWQTKLNDLEKRIKLKSEPIAEKRANLDAMRYMSMLKSGGKLTKEDKMEIERLKFNHKAKLKDLEMTYKAIMQSNELLQKALIKVFK